MNWPGRVAALMAALIDTAIVQTALEECLRRHLDEPAQVKPSFR